MSEQPISPEGLRALIHKARVLIANARGLVSLGGKDLTDLVGHSNARAVVDCANDLIQAIEALEAQPVAPPSAPALPKQPCWCPECGGQPTDEPHTTSDGVQYPEILKRPLPAEARQVVEEIVQAVAELPDRTSPDDWPEAMLVTADELRDIINRSLLASRPEAGQEIERLTKELAAASQRHDIMVKTDRAQLAELTRLRATQRAWDDLRQRLDERLTVAGRRGGFDPSAERGYDLVRTMMDSVLAASLATPPDEN